MASNTDVVLPSHDLWWKYQNLTVSAELLAAGLHYCLTLPKFVTFLRSSNFQVNKERGGHEEKGKHNLAQNPKSLGLFHVWRLSSFVFSESLYEVSWCHDRSQVPKTSTQDAHGLSCLPPPTITASSVSAAGQLRRILAPCYLSHT